MLPSHDGLHSPDDVFVWDIMSICRSCLLVMAKGPFSVHWPLNVALTLFLDKMLDVATYGPHRGKLRPLCQC